MDDLGQVLRDLNGKAITHHVTYYTDRDDWPTRQELADE